MTGIPVFLSVLRIAFYAVNYANNSFTVVPCLKGVILV